MSSKKTANYKLNQWEASDRVLRTEFNEDNAKIDAAIKALADGKADKTTLSSQVSTLTSRLNTVSDSVPRIEFGTYQGNAAASQYIELGYQPKALLVFRDDGCASFQFSRLNIVGGLAYPGHPIYGSRGTGIEIGASGFTVYYNSDNEIFSNCKAEFRYIAFA